MKLLETYFPLAFIFGKIIKCSNSNGNELIKSTLSGDIKQVKESLEMEPHLLDYQDREDWTPLIAAATIGHKQILDFLLEIGANVYLKSRSGWTALYCASRHGRVQFVKSLLRFGSNPLASDYSKISRTVLEVACSRQHIDFALFIGLYTHISQPLCHFRRNRLANPAISGHTGFNFLNKFDAMKEDFEKFHAHLLPNPTPEASIKCVEDFLEIYKSLSDTSFQAYSVKRANELIAESINLISLHPGLSSIIHAYSKIDISKQLLITDRIRLIDEHNNVIQDVQ